MKEYDLIIVGLGPAGITAGIYAKNFGLNFLIIGEEPHGLMNAAYKVKNYPGFFDITGRDLGRHFMEHLEHLGIVSKKERLREIKKVPHSFELTTGKNQYRARSLILAFGTESKKVGIKNVTEFEGKGVGYHACGSSINLKNKVVAIIGGANAAVMSCVMVAEEAKKVYLIYRQDRLRADKIWADKIAKLKNVEIIYGTNALDLRGSNKLEKIILDKEYKKTKELKVDNLFIEAGIVPNTFLLKNLKIKTNEAGYIVTKADQSTSTKGVYAVGDITTGSDNFRQIVTACSEGAIAALNTFKYLSK